MMMTEELVTEESGHGFPTDLRVWLAPEELLHAVLASLPAELPEEIAAPSRLGMRRKLALVIYSYATGRFGSPEICRELHADPVLGVISGSVDMSWHVIRSFRRSHRGLIERCLTQVLAGVRRTRDYAPALAIQTPGAESGVRLRKFGTQDRADGTAGAEAADRISRAVQLDSMAMDE